MAVRLVIGRAGTGKTALCVQEMRAHMARDPLGPPLLWVLPEQGTFSAERLLLTAEGSGRGTFRAQALSFRRLAMMIAKEVGVFAGKDAEGGIPKPMDEVARAVLLEETVRRERSKLSVFATVADRPGFLLRLDATLRELRQHGHTGTTLRAMLEGAENGRGFDAVGRRKLLDLAVLLDAWAVVVEKADAWDFEHVMHQAALKVGESKLIVGQGNEGGARIWVDAFSAMSALEIRMLAGLGKHARELTITLLADPDAAAIRDMRGPVGKQEDGESWGLFTRTERLHRRLVDAFRREQVAMGPMVPLRTAHRFIHMAVAKVEREVIEEGAEYVRVVEEEVKTKGRRKAAVATLFDAVEDLSAEREKGLPAAGRGGVEIWECSDPETEVRVAAQAIRDLVMGRADGEGGLRYRQIAVTVPELEEGGGGGYQDAIRRIFAEHNIPHFIDQRRSIGHHPLVELLRSAAAVVSSRFEQNELLLLLKTQLAGVTEEEVSLVENYVIEHGISHVAWAQAWTWIAPNQLEEEAGSEVPQSARVRLARINAIRARVWATLHGFIEEMGESLLGAGGARFPRALRQLLVTLNVEKQIQAWIDAARRGGDLELAQVHEQVWRETGQLLVLLESLLTERVRTLQEFERILATALQNLTLGLIPPTVDQVLVSSVTRSRVPEMEMVLVLGAVEGQFPKVLSEDPILSDAQREVFNAHAADPIGEGSDRQLLEMPFFDYVALTRARRRLVVSYPLANRQGKALGCSRHVPRLRELLGDEIVERKFDAASRTHVDRMATVDDLLASVTTWARQVRTSPLAAQANEGLMPEVYNWLVTSADASLLAARARVWQGLGGRKLPQLSEALALRFYPPGMGLRMSVSQLEKFASCPLQYFLLYTLGLRQRKEFALDQLGMGLLQHRILEQVYRRIIKGELVWPGCTAEALRAVLEKETDAAIAELHAEIAQSTPGYEKTRVRIKRTLGIMLEADRCRALKGELRPAAVELFFGKGEVRHDGQGRLVSLPVLSVPLPQHTLQVNGKIDRMDAAESRNKLVTVIDYKSAAQKSLELFRVYFGLSLQLPVYGLVMQELAGMQAMGALYITLGMNRESVERKSDAPEPDSEGFFQKFKPRGLVDASEAWRLDGALRLEAGADGKVKAASSWYKVKFNQDGTIPKNATDVLGHEDFQGLLAFTRWKIAALAQELTAGKIAPVPYRHRKEIPCEHCEFVSLCPFDGARDKFREVEKLPNEAILKLMREGMGGG